MRRCVPAVPRKALNQGQLTVGGIFVDAFNCEHHHQDVKIPPSKPWFTYDCYSKPLEKKAVSIVLFEPSLGEKLEFENPCRIGGICSKNTAFSIRVMRPWA